MKERMSNWLKGFSVWFFSFNLLWRFVCEVTNVIVIICTSYFMMVCLAHGLGRTHEYWYLALAAVNLWIVLYGAKLMQRKLGKTKLKR